MKTIISLFLAFFTFSVLSFTKTTAKSFQSINPKKKWLTQQERNRIDKALTQQERDRRDQKLKQQAREDRLSVPPPIISDPSPLYPSPIKSGYQSINSFPSGVSQASPNRKIAGTEDEGVMGNARISVSGYYEPNMRRVCVYVPVEEAGSDRGFGYSNIRAKKRRNIQKSLKTLKTSIGQR